MKARIYGRFSSKPQERGDSKRRQIEGAIAYAKKESITIVGTPYFDEAVSGKAGANLELEFGRLLDEANEGETILCEALDRIGRQNPFILGKLLYDTVQRGISVIAWQEGKTITKENIDNLDTQFSVFTGAAVGHADNKRKIDRLIKTTQDAYSKAEQGIQTGTLRKFLPDCFKWNPEKSKLELDEPRAEVIRRIFRMYADGIGITTICQTFNKEKVPTLYKSNKALGEFKPWMETSVKKVLRLESYAGVLNVKGHKITCIPVVVKRELFDQVQLLIKRNTRRMGKYNSRANNLFPGIAVCAHCGGSISVNVSPAKAAHLKPFYFYRCRNARLKLCKEPHKMLNAKLVESIFFLNYFGGSPENSFVSKSKETQEKIEALEHRITTLDRSIANLYDLAEEGDKEAKTRIGLRKNEQAELAEQITILKGSMVEEGNLPTMLQEIENLLTFGDLPMVATPKASGKDSNVTQLVKDFEARLEDQENRKKIANIIPALFSKVIFDCTKKTLQPITRQGKELPPVDLTTYGTIL